jgi:hypothetical protein
MGEDRQNEYPQIIKMAMENPPIVDDFPIQMPISWISHFQGKPEGKDNYTEILLTTSL